MKLEFSWELTINNFNIEWFNNYLYVCMIRRDGRHWLNHKLFPYQSHWQWVKQAYSKPD